MPDMSAADHRAIVRGHEEDAIVGQIAHSPRLRDLAVELEATMHQQGFLHLRTDDLARQLQTSKATLYRIATSLEGLFDFVIARWLARVRDRGWQGVEEGTTWKDKLARYSSASADLIAETDTCSQFWRDVRAFPRGNETLMAHQRMRVEGMAEIIAAGIDAGEFRGVNPELVSHVMEHCVRVLVDSDFVDPLGMTMGEAVREWYSIVEYGLIPNDT